MCSVFTVVRSDGSSVNPVDSTESIRSRVICRSCELDVELDIAKADQTAPDVIDAGSSVCEPGGCFEDTAKVEMIASAGHCSTHQGKRLLENTR